MPLIWIGCIVGIPVLYVLFSNPKPKAPKTSLYQASVRDEYPPASEVFATLKRAGIKPCFLNIEEEENENQN